MRKVERAIVELKAGEPVLVTTADQSRLIFSVEGLDSHSLTVWLNKLGVEYLSLTLTQKRLESLGVSHVDPLGGTFQLAVSPATCHGAFVRQLHDAAVQSTYLDFPSSNPGSPDIIEQAGLIMMRQGRLLPSAIAVDIPAQARPNIDAALYAQDLIKVEATDVLEFERSLEHHLRRISEAKVPLDGAEDTRFVLFREGGGLREHVALVIGEASKWPDPVPVRMHSACLTGDLFGSLRCDCGEQLRGAVQSMAKEGGGILLYLAQEGRDIGLANKLRAYSLQDQGLDTVDADQVLGFAEDERRYGIAVSILRSLDIDRIDLLTNNPAKIRAIQDGGIEIGKRRELFGRVTPYNRRYLTAKAERAGHLLDSNLKTGSQAS